MDLKSEFENLNLNQNEKQNFTVWISDPKNQQGNAAELGTDQPALYTKTTSHHWKRNLRNVVEKSTGLKRNNMGNLAQRHHVPNCEAI